MRHRFHARLLSGMASRLIPLLALGGLLGACREAEAPLGPPLYASQFSQASGHGLHGAIAFHRGATFNGDFEIYVMNADGNNVTQVTHNDINEFDPI